MAQQPVLSTTFTLLLAFASTPDPARIIRQAYAAWERDTARLTGYIYLDRTETRNLDNAGKPKSVTSKTHEMRMIEGSPYRRLLEQDGKPVSPEEQRLQEAYLKDNIERRKNESPAERRRRIAEYEKKRDRFKPASREIPDAFTFKLAGEETIQGRKYWLIDAAPRPGYEPKDRYSRLFPHVTARLWIDQQEHNWMKCKAQLNDVVAFGWILVRLGKGAQVEMEQSRLPEGLWVPSRLWYRVSARIGLVKNYHIEEETVYSGYRRNAR